MKSARTARSFRPGRFPALAAIAGICLLGYGATAIAFPDYMSDWEAAYQTSTLDERMDTATGSACNVCHNPEGTGAQGTCYKDQIAGLLDTGLTIEQALAASNELDADQDGTTNLLEITTARTDLTGEVGYHPGLAGPTGVDPCGESPTTPVTNVPETPPTTPLEDKTWGNIKDLYR